MRAAEHCFLLVYDAARRATASAIGGAVAVVFFFFVPVIFWKTQGKLTHSILGVAATAATLHAVVLVLIRPRASAFAWLGVALAIGLLAKYNFIFVIIALAVAVLRVPEIRQMLCRPAASLALLIPLLLSLPHWLWVRSHLGLAMSNFYRLRVPGGPLGLHISANSIWTGLWSLAVIILLSAAPMLLVCAGAMSIFRRDASNAARPEPIVARQMRQLLGWMLVAEFVLFIVAVLALVMMVVRPASIVTTENRLAFPYAEMARDIAKLVQPPAELVADPPEHAVNIAIRVPGLTSVQTPTAAQLLIIGNDAAGLTSLGRRFEDDYQPAGGIQIIEAPWHWRPTRTARLAVQLWEPRQPLHNFTQS